jgi:hypothetical protein
MSEENSAPEVVENNEVTAAMIRKLSMKIDGEDVEEDYDLSNEEQLKKDIQLARAAKKRMAEAQDQKRKAYDLVQQFEQDPASVLKRLGPKGYELAEQLLLEKIQGDMMTPEQKQLAELKAKLEKYEMSEKQQKEQAKLQEESAAEQKQSEYYQQVIIQALEKSGLPKTAESAKRMAFLLYKNAELGLDLDADDLAMEARKETEGYISALSKDSDAEKLIKLLGPEVVKKIRKFDLDNLKKKQLGQNPTKQLTQSSTKAPSQGKKYQTFEEWQEETNKRLKSEQ